MRSTEYKLREKIRESTQSCTVRWKTYAWAARLVLHETLYLATDEFNTDKQSSCVWSMSCPHRLNMELDIQSLFGLHVHSSTNWLRPRKPPPPHLGSYTMALLVNQERRHLFVSPGCPITVSQSLCCLITCKIAASLNCLLLGASYWQWLHCMSPQASDHDKQADKICRARIFRRVWGPGIDPKEWIPPAYVAWRAGTITLFLLGSLPHRLFKNSSSGRWLRVLNRLHKNRSA